MSNPLNDAKSAVNHGVQSAAEAAEHAFGAARKGAVAAKDTAERSAMNVVETALKGMSAAAGIVTMLRHLDLDDGLSWFGLERRRTPLTTVAIFGAGIVVGAGIGCLFAPMSGAAARLAILKAIRRGEAEVEHKAEEIVDKAEELANKAEAKAEEFANKAEAQVKKVVSSTERPNGRITPPNPVRS